MVPRKDFPLLSKSFKGYYPFRICAPSFIYPSTWSENVRLLSPFLDEVELLFFESRYPDSLPSRDEVKTLSDLTDENAISYNVHLPTDIDISDRDITRRTEAVETMKRVIALSEPLDPTTYTLHVPFGRDTSDKSTISDWQHIVSSQLMQLVAATVPAEKISIETLDYPFGWIADIVSDLGLSVCLDIGHLAIHGGNSADLYSRFQDRVAIIHLHGVRGQNDHVGITSQTVPQQAAVTTILESFGKTLSLEVFSYQQLVESLDWADGAFRSFAANSSNRDAS